MPKIQSMTVSNLKAVASQTADFQGCTAIITGANNAGKTTFLRGFIDRMQKGKPDQVLRFNESEGGAEIVLTSGEKLWWEVKGDKEKLTFVTEKGLKTALSKEIMRTYFPPVFDVDKFLQDTPKQQKAQLQKISGIDFTDIDGQYAHAYEQRTWANKVLTEAKAKAVNVEPGVSAEEISVAALSEQLSKAEKNAAGIERMTDGINERNARLLELDKEVADASVKMKLDIEQVHETLERKIEELKSEAVLSIEKITTAAGLRQDDARSEYATKQEEIAKAEAWLADPKNAPVEVEPIRKQIAEAETSNRAIRANNEAQRSQIALRKAEKDAKEADAEVKRIEAEKADILKHSMLPDGFGFNDDGITYNGLPFNRESLSLSAIYIAALKLASLGLGEVKTLHFEASALDRNSLAEIEAWAASQDLQLLIERPDFDGGEIRYELRMQTETPPEVLLVEHDPAVNATLFQQG